MCERYHCSFQNWYPRFRFCSIPSVFEPIPDDVLDYLRSDNVVLPRETVADRSPAEDEETYVGSIEWDPAGENDNEIEPPSFPEFSSKLKTYLENFEGRGYVKVNWSAPTDASWVVTNNSLKCTNVQDLYLLLKSSDKIAADLNTDYEYDANEAKYYIVIKKWKDIFPGNEYRCFVSNGNLIAISQRDTTKFYEHISQTRLEIVQNISQFFNTKVKEKFPLSNFTLDLVHTASGTVKIIDFGMFNRHSDSYLFTWDELDDMEYMENISPEFRYINKDLGIQPTNSKKCFGMPHDLTQLHDEETKHSLIQMLQNQGGLRSALNNIDGFDI